MNSIAPETVEYFFLNNFHFTLHFITHLLPKSYLIPECERTHVQAGREDLSNSLWLCIKKGDLKFMILLRTEYLDVP